MKNSTAQAGAFPTRSEAFEPPQTREMPLLFQLADINRSPVVAPAPVAAAAIPPGPGPLAMPPLPGTLATASTPLATAVSDTWSGAPKGLFEMPAGFSTAALTAEPATKVASPPVSEPKAVEREVAVAPPVVTEPLPAKAEPTSPLPKAIETAIQDAASQNDLHEPVAKPVVVSEPLNTAAPETAKSPEPSASTEPVAKEAETASADKPSPGSLRRQRAEARQQKVASKNGDWLQSHGKVIAIGFVIALIATIYLARRNRPSPEVAPAGEPPMGLAIDMPNEDGHSDHKDHDHHTAEAANTAPRLVEAPALPHDHSPSPATADSHASPATATADLHAPVLPPPTSTAPPANSAPLFPWQNDTQTATRPDAPATRKPATAAPLSTPNATAPPNGPAVNPPTYPETNLRDAPLLPPAPAVPASSGGQPASGQGSGRAPTRSNPASFTSAPGGTRYERTGSGLY